ncbi:MAG: hypothetical protein VW644_03925 [Alphaproteobacteria bacterium]
MRCNIFRRSTILAFAVTLCAAVALPGAALRAEQGYLQEVSDMPLPAGFTEDADAGVAFDKPEGRIVEAEVHGPMGPGEVLGFYRKTLPQLGWTASGPAGAMTWRREGESLRLDIAARGGETVVRFHIAPQ